MALDLASCSALGLLIERQRVAWPEHGPFLERSYGERGSALLETSETVARCICRLAESGVVDIDTLCADYRFLCEKIVLPEELFFRRHRRYRLSTFKEAFDECYSRHDFMTRYINGLLISIVHWRNHTAAVDHYLRVFLPNSIDGGRHIEVGPGHGLLLHLAATDPRCGAAIGWDISEASLSATARALKVLGGNSRVALALRDVFAPEAVEPADSIVLSEVLEHVEQAREGIFLKNALASLAPNGVMIVSTVRMWAMSVDVSYSTMSGGTELRCTTGKWHRSMPFSPISCTETAIS